MPRPKSRPPCPHTHLLLHAPGPSTTSTNKTNTTPFQPPSPRTILAATQRTSRVPSSTSATTAKARSKSSSKSSKSTTSKGHSEDGPGLPPPHALLPRIDPGTFPAALVLPGDALDVDLDMDDEDNDLEEPQDVAAWRGERERNRFAPPPPLADNDGAGKGVGKSNGAGKGGGRGNGLGKAARERSRRRVLYVIAPPEGVGTVPAWLKVKAERWPGVGAGAGGKGQGQGQLGRAKAKAKATTKGTGNARPGGAAAVAAEGEEDPEGEPMPPSAGDVARYIAAFYWPLEVRVWDGAATFVPWEQQGVDENGDVDMDRSQHDPDADDTDPAATASLALHFTGHPTIYPIRHRPPPDGAFPGQLNLNDVLDGVLATLPADAYAACLLLHQDLYEDAADDFCCGRAYGGSRIACVSMARYRPGLYVEEEGEERHWWPGGCCEESVGGCWEGTRREGEWDRERGRGVVGEGTAMRAAVDAVGDVKQDRDALWLGRVCKTTAHELGHCFGVAHCMYAACLMQATAGLEEDERQPPYLCPVDLMKLAWAMDEAGVVDMGLGEAGTTKARGTTAVRERSRPAGTDARMDVQTWLRGRYAALREVCGLRVGVDRLSTAFDAWLVCRLAELDALETGGEGSAGPEQPPLERMGKKSAGAGHGPNHARDVVVLSSDSE